MSRIIQSTDVVKELIRDKIDIFDLLEYYSVDLPRGSTKYDKIRTPCPIHAGDNPTAFSFDLNSKTFTCFTNHCGSSPDDWFFVPKNGASVSRDVFLFIRLMEERKAYERGQRNYRCSWPQVLKIASELSGVPINEETTAYNKEVLDKLDNQRWIRQMASVTRDIELEIFDESEIDMYRALLPVCDYINTRGFDEHTLDFFEVGFSYEGVDESYNINKDDFPGRIIFPVRDSDGNLVGWSGRLATDDIQLIKKYGKWKHKLDFDKGFVLYNYNNAKDIVKDSKEIILVEGAFDVIRLWSYGIHNAVAIMGSSLTPDQLSIAITSTMKAKVFLDGDGAGKSGAKRICEQLKPYVDVYVVEADNDPDDLSIDEAYIALDRAKKYVKGR